MPRAGDGTYTLPSGNPVQTGTTIETAWANSTLSDIATQLNNVLTRDGLLGPTQPFLAVAGTAGNPGVAFATESGLGVYRKAAGTLAIVAGGTELASFENTGPTFAAPVPVTQGGTGSATAADARTALGVASNGTGPTQVRTNAQNDGVYARGQANEVYIGAAWKLVLSGTTLRFTYNGTVVAQLTSAGAFTAKNDVIRNTSL